eukprot:Opistho-1_new@79024
MRGAGFLTGLSDAIVADIGGTTCDVGAIVGGFPRFSAVEASVGGIRTNFRMPDVLSVGLGGGSIVRVGSDGVFLSVGPQSVGHRIRVDAIACGGHVLTATDIALAYLAAQGEALPLGDAARLDGLLPSVVAAARDKFRCIIEETIDRVKLSRGDVPVVLVGGGVLVAHGLALAGASKVVVPPHAGCANAIGAAIAQVSAEVDYVASGMHTPADRDRELSAARSRALAGAVAAGGIESTCEVLTVEEIPVSYVPGAVRIRVKAVAELSDDCHVRDVATEGRAEVSVQGETKRQGTAPSEASASDVVYAEPAATPRVCMCTSSAQRAAPPATAAGEATRGTRVLTSGVRVDMDTGDWLLSANDVEAIAIGCGILGTGGGGSVHTGRSRALRSLAEGRTIRVRGLNALSDDARVFPLGFMGAPTVLSEKCPGGTETLSAVRGMEAHTHVTADCVASIEIGGSNGLEPLVLSAATGLPVVDGDGMGRAFSGTADAVVHSVRDAASANGHRR